MRFTPVVLQRAVLVVAVFGAFLPWVTLGPARITGTSTTEGMLTLVAAGIGLLLTFSTPSDPKARTFEFVIASIAVLAPGWFYLDHITGEENFGASPGYGLFMCIPTSLAWLGWLAWGSVRKPRYRGQRPPRRMDDWG